MDHARALIAMNQLETLRQYGQLTPGDYRDRLEALEAVLPAGDRRRGRRSARPIWWFATCEVACKAAIVAYAVFVT